MKKNALIITNTLLCLGLAAGLLAGCASEKEDADKSSNKPAGLAAEAKISKADAEQIAMTKVPNGKIKEAELERENGHLQWSFDMVAPGQAEDTITEVNIDAITGDVIAIGTEKDND
jgi:uncharacterized membrane protein YkoI